jgi:hypothetical protein
MESMLSTLAFALLIGGQFLAAIVVIARRKAIYGEQEGIPAGTEHPSSESIQSATAGQELPVKAG